MLHQTILFSHVAGMIGLFAALTVEWVSLRSLRRATSYEQARESAGLWSLLAPLGGPSLLVVLASGAYLATTLGVWVVGWVEVAVPTLVVVAIAGGITGPHKTRIRVAIATNAGPLTRDLQTQLRQSLVGIVAPSGGAPHRTCR